MSKDIFVLYGLIVTAFVGEKGNASIQISVTNNKGYVQLSEEDSLKLVHSIISRIIHKEGYRATD